MDGHNFEIYNKCIFKTIPYHDLKAELESRSANFSPSDTYYILTLRLRKDILEKLEIQPSVRKQLDKEIDVFEKTKNKSGSVYECCVPGCPFRNLHHRKYLAHLGMAHYNSKSRLVCQFRHSCTRDFLTMDLLKKHLSRDHAKHKSTVIQNQNQLVEELITLKCVESSCGNQSVSNISVLKKHILQHTERKEETQCIFCEFKTDTTGTMKSHMSRKHRVQTVEFLNSKFVVQRDFIESSDIVPNDENENNDESEGVDDNFCVDPSIEDIDEDEYEMNSDDVFVKALAITINTWMNVSGIAYTTVNTIVKEVFESYDRGRKYTRGKVLEIVKKTDLCQEEVLKIIDAMDGEDPFEKAKMELLIESRRKKFIFKTFPNVQPLTILLPSNGEGKQQSYQYVPIGESLKVLIEDDTYIKQKHDDPYYHEEDIYKDTRDGDCYRENVFFQNNPEAVPLIVFQDELEVVNPLGSAKTRHKINCTYYSTMCIQPALRSKVSSIQLVSLVLSKYWKIHGNDLCNAKFVEDLKVLEEDGLKIEKPVETTIKVGLMYIVGDNLGAHNLSEIGQSFSSGLICRWCKATYQDVCRNNLVFSGYKDGYAPEIWSPEEYDRVADIAEDDDSFDDSCGVKRHCTFNQLKSFHCIGGLPPCLGHDFYEGVFSYDIQAYLEYLINKEKLITAENFNKKLKRVTLSERDSKNRPKEFKTRKKNSKYEGNAGSLRILSRIVTLMISEELEASKVKLNIVKLQEVSEIITAPRLSKYEVENNLKYTILEYLERRVSAIEDFGMDSLKPKHHYLAHYPDLYAKHGPLIFLWAMRMEAKHTFFKNCIRTSKNFINVSKTCAQRHQMAQISYTYNGLFPRRLDIPPHSLSRKEVCKINPDPFLKLFLEKLSENAIVPPKLEVHGTKYEPGMVLVLGKADFGQTLTVGLLRTIAVDQEDVMFGCESFEAEQSEFGYYVTTKVINKFLVINHSDLADYHPLKRVGSVNSFCFCLHHFISSSSSS